MNAITRVSERRRAEAREHQRSTRKDQTCGRHRRKSTPPPGSLQPLPRGPPLQSERSAAPAAADISATRARGRAPGSARSSNHGRWSPPGRCHS